MNYRKDKYGRELSILGYGCMRFPRKGSATDFEQTEAQILKAIELGINILTPPTFTPAANRPLARSFTKTVCGTRYTSQQSFPTI